MNAGTVDETAKEPFMRGGIFLITASVLRGPRIRGFSCREPYPKVETEKRCSQGNAGNISIRHIRFDRDASDLKAFLSDGKGAVVLLEGAVADGTAFVMVARVDGSVAGWAVVRTAYRSDTGWQPEGGTVSFVEGVNAYLEYLEVSEPFRRRGVGTELLLACHRESGQKAQKADMAAHRRGEYWCAQHLRAQWVEPP